MNNKKTNDNIKDDYLVHYSAQYNIIITQHLAFR